MDSHVFLCYSVFNLPFAGFSAFYTGCIMFVEKKKQTINKGANIKAKKKNE